MDNESILRKLRACLRLSKSANQHEAAAAIRQARKIMDKYGLTEDDAFITSAEAPLRHRAASIPPHIGALCVAVAGAFNCFVVRSVRGNKARVVFHGTEAATQCAAAAFALLRRQLERDMTKHTKRVRVVKNKRARQRVFAEAWVHAVSQSLPSDMSDERWEALKLQVEKTTGELAATKVSENDPVAKHAEKVANDKDRAQGWLHGKAARASERVNGSTDLLKIGREAA